jgi:hypothetical protein
VRFRSIGTANGNGRIDKVGGHHARALANKPKKRRDFHVGYVGSTIDEWI